MSKKYQELSKKFTVEELLYKLAEEAMEVGKEAMKAAQFGLDDYHEEVSNLERLANELNDLIAVVRLLEPKASQWEGDLASPSEETVSAKAEKMLKWKDYAIQRKAYIALGDMKAKGIEVEAPPVTLPSTTKSSLS